MVNAQVFGERRLHQRKECAFPITVEDPQSAYLSYIRNLSLGGALVEQPPGRRIRVGENITLTIPFQLKRDSLVIEGKIMRIQAGRMGIIFRT